jgi:hypothetical protein
MERAPMLFDAIVKRPRRHSGAREARTPNLEIPGSMLRIAPE